MKVNGIVRIACLSGLLAVVVMALNVCAQDDTKDIFSLMKAGKLDEVQAALVSNPALATSINAKGATPLHVAVYMKKVELLRFLIAKGADVNAKTREGYTPLHVAAIVKAGDVALELVSKGADATLEDNSGRSPFQMAIENNATDVVKLLTTRTKAVYTEKTFDVRYKDGEAAKASGTLEKAYDIYAKLVRQDPDNEKICFAMAMLCLSMDELGKAQSYLEHIVSDINPKNYRARLDLARAYMMTGNGAAARAQFEAVLSHDPGDPAVRREIQQGLAALSKSGRQLIGMGRLDFGYIHDDNVNVGPDSVTIGINAISLGSSESISTLTVDESSQPKSVDGGYASLALSGMYDAGNGWAATADGAYYQNSYSGSASVRSNESVFGQIVVGARRTWSESLLRLPLRCSMVQRGGEPLMNMFALTPSYQKIVGRKKDYAFTMECSGEMRDWDEMNDRDSTYMMLGGKLQHVWGKRKNNLAMGLSIFQDKADSPVYENAGHTWTFSGDFKLPHDVALYGRIRNTSAEYSEKEELSPEDRKDNQYELVGGINWRIVKWFGVDMNYAATENNSTFGLYQYDRNVATVSAFVTF